MSKPTRTEQDVPIDRIFLYLENPRHEPYETQAQVIDYLCKYDDVLALAQDIAKHGLNPLERFALFKDKEQGSNVFIVAEGNRRMCAIKLLHDPDLAPPDKRKEFERLSGSWSRIDVLPCVIFHDWADLDLWLSRTHQGPQGGIGRKPWNAIQKQRHSGGNKNRLALLVIDIAVELGLMRPEDAKGKLTTLQRYLDNPLVREALGIDLSDPEEVRRNRPSSDFALLLKKLINDLLSGRLSSRSSAPDRAAYARELSAQEGQSRKSVTPEPVTPKPPPPDPSTENASQPKPKRPERPAKPRYLPYDTAIASALEAFGNWKLQSLYHSLCRITLADNTPLLAVGVWSFIETLTANAGRHDHIDFLSFFSKARMQNYGLGDGKKTKVLSDAIGRIQSYGNTTKHHETSAAFDGEQLANDLGTLRDVILKCIEEARP